MLNRREALLRLLRLGGVAAGTAGLGLWLSENSQRAGVRAGDEGEAQSCHRG